MRREEEKGKEGRREGRSNRQRERLLFTKT